MEPTSPDILWAPWRLAYVQGAASARPEPPEPPSWRPGSERTCFLCRAASADAAQERDLGIVARSAASVVVVNRFPYSSGHLLVAPLDHLAALADLDAGLLLDLQQRIVEWCGLLEERLEARGFNIGLNVGAVAGAGVPGHLHWHIVPRWPGDVNFMPAVAAVRVLPQALDALWEQLRR